MKAIILAAGQGTRLKKYTENLPKGMLSFKGQTIIERQIKMYRKCGISDIIIVTGFESKKIHYAGVKYYNNDNYATTNMVESLMCAKDEFTDDIVVSYSDIVFDEHMLETMILEKGDFLCAVDDNWKDYWEMRYGTVDYDTESLSIDKYDNIIELGAENPPLEDIDARYIGLLKFSLNAMNQIVEIINEAHKESENKPWQQSGNTVKKAYMTDLLNAVIKTGQNVKAVHFSNGWIEFDTNEDYEKAIEWTNTGEMRHIINID